MLGWPTLGCACQPEKGDIAKSATHQMCGAETPAFNHGEEAPLPLSVAACLWQKRALSRGGTASYVPNAGNSERQRPQGRGDSGCLGYVDGSDRPTLVVNRPPDANPVGMCGNLSTGLDSTPEGAA
jgi:hypothetical protein